jgi:hypothetical protein
MTTATTVGHVHVLYDCLDVCHVLLAIRFRTLFMHVTLVLSSQAKLQSRLARYYHPLKLRQGIRCLREMSVSYVLYIIDV